MKHYAYILLALILVSCGPSDGRFRLEGQFKNLNQGEFYIYDYEQGTKDTIGVRDGRFVYDVPLHDTLVLTLMFPNFSELPIFARPGTEVKIDGDVSHLRDVDVSGTDENEQMTAFRIRTNDMMPPEVQQQAVQFISQNLQSPVSIYLLRRYCLLTQEPDYKQCYELCQQMLEVQPTNIPLVRLSTQLQSLYNMRDSGQLPSFSATDTEGREVSEQHLKSKANIIYLWASWDYSSQSTMRQLHVLKKKHGNNLSIVTIALDSSPAEGENLLKSDSITWPNICDGQLWQSPILQQLGLVTLPAAIVINGQGNIVGRAADYLGIKELVETLLEPAD